MERKVCVAKLANRSDAVFSEYLLFERVSERPDSIMANNPIRMFEKIVVENLEGVENGTGKKILRPTEVSKFGLRTDEIFTAQKGIEIQKSSILYTKELTEEIPVVKQYCEIIKNMEASVKEPNREQRRRKTIRKAKTKTKSKRKNRKH